MFVNNGITILTLKRNYTLYSLSTKISQNPKHA